MTARAQRYNLLAALAAAVLGISASLALSWNAEREEQAAARERFQFKQREIQIAVRQRLLAYEQVLRSAVGLFAASQGVEREEWHAYVRNLRIDQHYPGIQGIGFSRWLTADQRPSVTDEIRRQGLPTFELWPTGERDSYTAIVYLEPLDWRNQRALGYDMFSEPVRHEAMVRARDLGQPAVSGRVRLVQETSESVQHGFLMYLPVYPRGQVPDSLEERRRSLVGFVYSPFRMNDLMAGTLGERNQPNIRLQIFDGDAAETGQLMYDSEWQQDGLSPLPRFTSQALIEINGRPWTLQFSSLPYFESMVDTQKAEWVLSVGLLVSLLFAGLLWSQGENRSRARQLARANHGLQNEIVERRKLEAELTQARDHAEAANRAKSNFLANVSHELRTPLALILAPLEQLFASVPPDGTGRSALERMQRNALLLLNRVNDILDFAKAEAGKFELHEERVDLREVLAPLAEDTAHLAEQKGCALDWQIAEDLRQVRLDRNQLEKIVLNLLSNALKFTPAGGHICLIATGLDDQRLQIEVSDSGTGIAAEQLPLLFQRFQQLDNSATRQHGGTGIGLALAKELVELMGGSIVATSAAGQGSCFRVCLPRNGSGGRTAVRTIRPASDTALRRARLEESAPAHLPPADGADQPTPPADAPRLLIADDNPDMRHYLAELLHGECRVECVSNGLQAWERLQREPFDLLLTDVMMPELDGLALTRRIKQDPRLAQLPVLLVTARGGLQASVSGLESGADDYIAKPFAADELRARVRAALRMAQTQQLLRERAHEAGVALLANGILHNLGNVLNGINVASTSLRERLLRSRVDGVRKLAQLLQSDPGSLAQFFSTDGNDQALPAFVAQLAECLGNERTALLKDVELLSNCAEHANAVLACQRLHSRPARNDLREPLDVQPLLHGALELARGALGLDEVQVEQEYAYRGAVLTERHRTLQILLNLLSNAHRALAEHSDKRLWLRVSRDVEGVRIAIQDNGAGMDARQLARLFQQGASSKGQGHGYGLHLSALWAEELGGRLSGHSDGPGQGACFTLLLPVPSEEQTAYSLPAVPEGAED